MSKPIIIPLNIEREEHLRNNYFVFQASNVFYNTDKKYFEISRQYKYTAFECGKTVYKQKTFTLSYFNSDIHLIVKIYDAYYIFINELTRLTLLNDLEREQTGRLPGRSVYLTPLYPLSEITKNPLLDKNHTVIYDKTNRVYLGRKRKEKRLK